MLITNRIRRLKVTNRIRRTVNCPTTAKKTVTIMNVLRSNNIERLLPRPTDRLKRQNTTTHTGRLIGALTERPHLARRTVRVAVSTLGMKRSGPIFRIFTTCCPVLVNRLRLGLELILRSSLRITDHVRRALPRQQNFRPLRRPLTANRIELNKTERFRVLRIRIIPINHVRFKRNNLPAPTQVKTTTGKLNRTNLPSINKIRRLASSVGISNVSNVTRKIRHGVTVTRFQGKNERICWARLNSDNPNEGSRNAADPKTNVRDLLLGQLTLAVKRQRRQVKRTERGDNGNVLGRMGVVNINRRPYPRRHLTRIGNMNVKPIDQVTRRRAIWLTRNNNGNH